MQCADPLNRAPHIVSDDKFAPNSFTRSNAVYLFLNMRRPNLQSRLDSEKVIIVCAAEVPAPEYCASSAIPVEPPFVRAYWPSFGMGGSTMAQLNELERIWSGDTGGLHFVRDQELIYQFFETYLVGIE